MKLQHQFLQHLQKMFDKNKLNGKGLFVFSDPGGAKPLLALVTLIKNNLNDYRIISDRKYDFYDEFGLNVHVPNILSDFDNFKPDFLFTGTSYTSKLELKYIEKSILTRLTGDLLCLISFSTSLETLLLICGIG